MNANLRVLAIALTLSCSTSGAFAAAIIFDDFNTGEGHFTREPTFSGSTAGILTTSTADQVGTDAPLEGPGHEKLVLNWDGTSSAQRVRFLSGTGAAANNTSFATTVEGEDGWIGFWVRTTAPGWTGQIWLEGQENNGSVPKAIEPDGQWHLYEWNLDDETGEADGWGSVANIVTGDPDFEAGTYTIDSIIFRHADTPVESSTLFLDFVAKSNSGSVALTIPEPSAALLTVAGALSLLGSSRRRSS